jgi:nitroreductase
VDTVTVTEDLARLLRARYGEAEPSLPPPEGLPASDRLAGLLAHRSVRRFLPDPLPPGALEWLVAAAQSAPTSSNLQTWSVIAIEGEERRAEAARLCATQDFIRQAPLFLVFIADLSRLRRVGTSHGTAGEGLDYLEMFLTAALDAALAAQNAAVAAESMGLGICYVGAARNHPLELARFLGLPPGAFAVFGMAVGRPDPDRPASTKPRLPQAEVLHRERYSEDGRSANLAAYDAEMQRFNEGQGRVIPGSWSLHSARRVATATALQGRDGLKAALRALGFALK